MVLPPGQGGAASGDAQDVGVREDVSDIGKRGRECDLRDRMFFNGAVISGQGSPRIGVSRLVYPDRDTWYDL